VFSVSCIPKPFLIEFITRSSPKPCKSLWEKTVQDFGRTLFEVLLEAAPIGW
jgi:hypothetical protein